MNIRKKYIYDLLTRILHAGIAGSCLLLFLTAKLARFFYENGNIRHLFWMIHIYIGYLLIGLISVRLVWFFTGPKYARLSNLIKIKEWKEILVTKKMKWGWGHHPTASIAYIFIYLVIGFLIYSGIFLARIQFDMGPIASQYYDQVMLLDDFLEGHETASLLVIAFSIVHVLALFWHQINDQVPIFKSMRTGFQYKRFKEGELDENED